MVVESLVTNIIAAIAYDKGKRVYRGMFSPQEKELEKALKEYLNNQMSQFGQDGASIIEAIPLRECTGELYREIIASRADSDYILDQLMPDSNIENYDKIRATCRGCIDIIINHVKR